ncbi:ABC transporter ATP-binding protein [Cereibacter changlensis JA139]|uniref:ABC transporter ATP-binding protein n=2 Tax=Cereibacter changlensis TaxID=402884 RepID=A0A2T4JPJ0_9RHOB|nr:ABC transporter substrate-binding protein [Cereibacter changlensis]PTE19677.1 ABC transporter ATP-binding protein [Cereibacter changlensis JA139]PZX57518.1 putative hydroxymethylpyrimidine transport system substrate-binding protein [Cereibacter changlensis]
MKPLALAALLLATPASAEEFTVMLDWFVNPDHGPIIIAQEKGYFAERGLEVTIVPPADPADPPKMAAAGRADLAVSYQPQLHLMVAEGLPLRRVGTLIGTPLNCLLVLQDGPVQELGDLRGKRIGFSVSGIHEALIGAILAEAGLTPADVELVNVNWSLSPALMSGQVDAVIGAFRNFELNQMEIEERPGRCFAVEEVGVPSYEELVYVANPETMNGDAIARFLAATEEAAADIAADPEAAWQIFSATAPELQDELNARAWVDTVPFFAAHPAELHAKRYSAFSAFLAEAGLIPAPQPVEDLALTLPPVAE